MRIFAINNAGGGYADHMTIDAGTSVEKLFAQMVPGGRAEDYLVRVNRLPVARDHVLQEGDRVSITPLKVEGAQAA
jgi:sulfur carrier protein ThiS